MKARRRERFAVSSALLLAAAALAAGVGPALGQPDTEPVALAWVEAFNSGDAATMARFMEIHAAPAAAAGWRSELERWVAEWGRLDVMGVDVGGGGGVRLMLASERGGRIRLAFAFDAEGRLLGVRPALEEGDASRLPPLEIAAEEWRARGRELDRWLRDLAARDLFSGAVMVVERGDVRFQGAYGLASREFAVPNSLGTRFDVGSFNKDYTRAAVLQLVAAGRLALHDKVGRHLPDYPNPRVRGEVTLDQLLEHSSGLGDYFTEEYDSTPMRVLRDTADYIPIWGPKPLLFDPGTRTSYSNFGYTVLGAVIEAVSGTSYFDYVESNIFAPAGMTESGFFETDRPEPNVAVGYTRTGPDGEPSEVLYKNIYLEPARGGPWGKSYSTIGDLYRFFEAMFEGRLLPEELNWLRAGWDSGGVALAGGGPGLNAMLTLEEGLMILVTANLDPPIARDVAQSIRQALARATAARTGSSD